MLTEFDIHPKEKALIGEMLLAYGEIEFAIVAILGILFGLDYDRAAQVLFRVHGEGPRIAVADGLLLKALKQKGLGDLWNLAYGAVKHCKSIRNQYAHCHWFKREIEDPKSPIMLMNVDQDASARVDDLQLNFVSVDLTLLQQQHQYFDYTLDLLRALDEQYRKASGLPPAIHDWSVPKSIPAPRLSNPRG